MKIFWNNNYQPNFGSKKTFKRQFKTCAYSGEKFETHNTRTIEHIIPSSEGGEDDYSNYLIVKKRWNEKRSSTPLDEFIKKYPQVEENIKKAVKQKEGKTIEDMNWAEEVKKTITKAIGRNIFE